MLCTFGLCYYLFGNKKHLLILASASIIFKLCHSSNTKTCHTFKGCLLNYIMLVENISLVPPVSSNVLWNEILKNIKITKWTCLFQSSYKNYSDEDLTW